MFFFNMCVIFLKLLNIYIFIIGYEKYMRYVFSLFQLISKSIKIYVYFMFINHSYCKIIFKYFFLFSIFRRNQNKIIRIQLRRVHSLTRNDISCNLIILAHINQTDLVQFKRYMYKLFYKRNNVNNQHITYIYIYINILVFHISITYSKIID